MYPPFDHKDIRIDTMGYRKKWVNALQNKRADEQKSGSDESAGHARKATIAPCDQTSPTSHGPASPVPMEQTNNTILH